MSESHTPVLTVHTYSRKNRQSCFSPSNVTHQLEITGNDFVNNDSKDISYCNVFISAIKSDIMVDGLNSVPIIVHSISISLNNVITVIQKTSNDLYEFDAFFKTYYEESLFPTFPKRNIPYPLRDTALYEYFQSIVNIPGICESEYFKQWMSIKLPLTIISLRRPTISGELKKEGYVLKRWVVRYVLVKRNYLIYFVSEKEFAKLTLPTIIDLKGANVKVVDMKEKTFKIELPSGAIYLFKTSSRELLGEWVVALQSSTILTPRRRDRRQSVYSDESPPKSHFNGAALHSLISTIPNNEDIIAECIKIEQTHKEDIELCQLCKKLESIDLLDPIELSQIIGNIKQISKHKPEDVQLLKLIRLVSSNELRKTESRSRSGSRQNSRGQSRKQSIGGLDISQFSSNESSTTVTPRSRVVCRICEARVIAESLARHTYYCKTLNEICMKVTTDAERLKGVVEEAKRVFELKKNESFKRLIEVAESATRIMGESLMKQYENLKVYTSVTADLTNSFENDVCGYVFSFYIQKLINHKTDILGKFIQSPNNPRQLLNVLGAGVRLDESWNIVGLQDFEIIKRLNGGAYSSVYLVRKKVTNDIYAMKIMKKADMIRKNVVDGILAEKTILQNAQHSSVVKMYYAFQDKHNLFLVMEFCPGGDLRLLLDNVVCLDEMNARVYSAEIVLALEYIHSLGCIHRDLKPDNILIDRNGHLLLTDFGLSTIGSKLEQTFEDSRLVCTPDYVAPESIVSFQYSRCSDYFSLGCIIYELVCGIPPFHQETPDAIFQSIRSGKYTWPDHVNPSDELQSLISALLTVESHYRLGYLSINEIKNHSWFQGINWNTLLSENREDIFVPNLSNEIDTIYFENENENQTHDSLPKDLESEGLSPSPSLRTKSNENSEKFKKFNCVSVHHLLEDNMIIAGELTANENDIDEESFSSSEVSLYSYEEEAFLDSLEDDD